MLTCCQVDSQSDAILDERVHSPGTSRRCSSRTPVKGDPRFDSPSSAGVVPEQVCRRSSPDSLSSNMTTTRRAKLKRLTTNDRERMLKSRALPEDFDTTKVLRTPFGSRSNGHTPVASPHSFGAPNPDFAALRALRTDFFHRPNDDEYLVSPLSSASTAGTYMSSAGRGDGLPPSSMMFGRPAATASMSDLHRSIRSDYSITRSSSLSEASSQPQSFQSGVHLHNRFGGQNGMPYMRQPMEYGVSRGSNGMMAGYDQQQPFEGSVSPTDSQGGQMAYDMSGMAFTQSSKHPSRKLIKLLH